MDEDDAEPVAQLAGSRGKPGRAAAKAAGPPILALLAPLCSLLAGCSWATGCLLLERQLNKTLEATRRALVYGRITCSCRECTSSM